MTFGGLGVTLYLGCVMLRQNNIFLKNLLMKEWKARDKIMMVKKVMIVMVKIIVWKATPGHLYSRAFSLRAVFHRRRGDDQILSRLISLPLLIKSGQSN